MTSVNYLVNIGLTLSEDARLFAGVDSLAFPVARHENPSYSTSLPALITLCFTNLTVLMHMCGSISLF